MGPWSDPAWLPFDGIDPSLFVDDDGRAWIVSNGAPEGRPQYDGHRSIWIQQFDLATRKMVGPRKVLVDGGVDILKKPVWTEGPHVFRHEGHYYLLAAEGGTGEEHSQTVFRSDRIDGTYAPSPRNPILTQRDLPTDRPAPITSAGHADFVRTPNGEYWATFLATRPYRGDLYNIGRETFLAPVRWIDGWPLITAPGEKIRYAYRRPPMPRGAKPPVPTSGNFSLREEFTGKTLAPYWMMVRTPREQWYSLGGGMLTIRARPWSGTAEQPSFIARRLQHHSVSISTALRYSPAGTGDAAGLMLFQSDEHNLRLGVTFEAGKRIVRLQRRAGDGSPVTLASAPIGARARVFLRADARGGRYDFYYGFAPGRWRLLAKDVDGTVLSTRVAGGFVDTTVGPYAVAGP